MALRQTAVFRRNATLRTARNYRARPGIACSDAEGFDSAGEPWSLLPSSMLREESFVPSVPHGRWRQGTGPVTVADLHRLAVRAWPFPRRNLIAIRRNGWNPQLARTVARVKRWRCCRLGMFELSPARRYSARSIGRSSIRLELELYRPELQLCSAASRWAELALP